MKPTEGLLGLSQIFLQNFYDLHCFPIFVKAGFFGFFKYTLFCICRPLLFATKTERQFE